MEQLFASSIQNFNFVELLCVFLITKGVNKFDAIEKSINRLTDSVIELEKRIEKIEIKIEEKINK